MQKLCVFLCFMLSGCFSPKFLPYQQEIEILHAPGVEVGTNGKRQESEATKAGHKIKINRSFWDLRLTLEKEGFESKEIILKSHATHDKWAYHSELTSSSTVSAIWLTPPIETVSWTLIGFSFGVVGPIAYAEDKGGIAWSLVALTPITTIVGTVGGFVFGAGWDIFNTLGIPATIIHNPWYEYDPQVNLSQQILTPTPEFEKSCHAKKKSFIGNHECLSCDIKTDKVVATEEECNRCPNRKMVDGRCVLKCRKGQIKLGEGHCTSCNVNYTLYDVSQNECESCHNREWKNGRCEVKCFGNTFKEGQGCMACDFPHAVYSTTEEECQKCPNREWVNNACQLQSKFRINIPSDTQNFEQKCHDQKGIVIGRECFMCSFEGKISAVKEECDRCQNREMWGDLCLLKCPPNHFRKNYGVCVSCIDPSAYKTSEAECKKCTNRKWHDSTCYLQ